MAYPCPQYDLEGAYEMIMAVLQSTEEYGVFSPSGTAPGLGGIVLLSTPDYNGGTGDFSYSVSLFGDFGPIKVYKVDQLSLGFAPIVSYFDVGSGEYYNLMQQWSYTYVPYGTRPIVPFTLTGFNETGLPITIASAVGGHAGAPADQSYYVYSDIAEIYLIAYHPLAGTGIYPSRVPGFVFGYFYNTDEVAGASQLQALIFQKVGLPLEMLNWYAADGEGPGTRRYRSGGEK